MMAEDFVDELSNLKAGLVLAEGIDMESFNKLYDTAVDLMIQGGRADKEMMEEFLYFRNLLEE